MCKIISHIAQENCSLHKIIFAVQEKIILIATARLLCYSITFQVGPITASAKISYIICKARYVPTKQYSFEKIIIWSCQRMVWLQWRTSYMQILCIDEYRFGSVLHQYQEATQTFNETSHFPKRDTKKN